MPQRRFTPPKGSPMATVYKIHPAIGIARLGTSTETFPAPTIPGVPGNIDPSNGHTLPYRDNTAGKKLKAQAAQFWVYAYDTANPSAEPVQVEAGPGKPIVRIEWTVH